ncbi:hypothetical protein PHSY_006365 [Pseudozyma hubeiensis SY62]|uniref:Uncharacterized protein n=1 Tax=Pseudozyma hubeiensis (strain SY62) TaxID=1305764 RepID=R9PL03_PSEHS|nr:hypothetical protein PHSY_006365 [Pseudozyma hubeiensis SY62]GAC98770.1 hypothetical protein PHSY_006365 [Pseudozyma hubeiensis SY62]
MMRFAAVLIFMTSLLRIRASDLHINDLDRLLQEDWSVIERLTAPQAASVPSRGVAMLHGAMVVGAPGRGSKRLRYGEQHQITTSGSSTPFVITQDNQVLGPLFDRIQSPVHLPRVIEPLSVEARERELTRLSSVLRKSLTRSHKERWVAPLSLTNLDAQEYMVLCRQYLYRETRARYFWESEGSTYMLYKPIKLKGGLEALFGLTLQAWVNGWAIWRQEIHGGARLWHLLGMMEMPSYEVTKRFLEGSTESIPPPHKLPDQFFNDGAHLDEMQGELRPKLSGVESQDESPESSGHPTELT